MLRALVLAADSLVTYDHSMGCIDLRSRKFTELTNAMSFIAYKITHSSQEKFTKFYVGITQRTLADRLAAHLNESTRKKPRGLSKFSLGFAIRDHLINCPDIPVKEAFLIEELENYSTLQDMRNGEINWIKQLKAMAPNGYNLMPGGSSVGGPSNEKPCILFLGGNKKEFKSFAAAAREVASKHLGLDEHDIKKFTANARARLKSGWTITEALELDSRIDDRHTELSRAAREAGENLATARSRKQREKVKVARLANNFSIKTLIDKETQKSIPWRIFFERAGISKATGRYRLNQIADKLHKMTFDEVKSHISTAQDRTKLIAITLPGELEEKLGANAWANVHKRKGLGFAAIKRRLKVAGPNATNDELLIAIGINSAPLELRGVVQVAPQSRKKHCSNWTIENEMKSREFVNQADFVNACIRAIKKSKINQHFLGKQPDNESKVKRSIQSRISTATKKGQTPSAIAKLFGILEPLLRGE